MQMEDNTADELATKVLELVSKVRMLTGSMEVEFSTRVRELFIEAVGAQVTAMENVVNAMSLLIVQAKDAGFVECNRRVDETLARMSGTRLGKMGEVKVNYHLPEDDDIKAAIAKHTENTLGQGLTNEQFKEKFGDISLDLDDPVNGTSFSTPATKLYDDRIAAKNARLKAQTAEMNGRLEAHVAPISTTVSTASVIGMDETAGLVTTEGHRVVDMGNCDCNGASLGCSGACMANTQETPRDRALDELAHAVAEDGFVIHKLKIWPQYFEDVKSEIKSFEVRLDDRNFKTGDYLDLREYNQGNDMYTGRRLLREITYRVDLAPLGLTGHVALGIGKVKPVNG